MRDWTEQIDHLRLVRTEGVGPVTYRRLIERYRTPAAALDALPRLARAGGRIAAPKVMTRADAEREWEQTAKRGGQFVFAADPAYPAMLGMLDDAPPCLILLGD